MMNSNDKWQVVIDTMHKIKTRQRLEQQRQDKDARKEDGGRGKRSHSIEENVFPNAAGNFYRTKKNNPFGLYHFVSPTLKEF